MKVDLEIVVTRRRKIPSSVVGRLGIETSGRLPGIGHAVVIRIRRGGGRTSGVGGQEVVAGGIRVGRGGVDPVLFHRRDEPLVHRIAGEGSGIFEQAFTQRSRRGVGDRGKRMPDRARCRGSRSGVGHGHTRIVVAAIEEFVIGTTGMKRHRVATHKQLIPSRGRGPQDLVVPHAVGKGGPGAEDIAYRVEPIVDRIGLAEAVGDDVGVGSQRDEKARVPVEVVRKLEVHRAAGGGRRLARSFGKAAFDPHEEIVMDREAVEGETVGGVRIVHQHSAVEGVASDRLGEEAVLDGEAVGIRDLDGFVLRIADRDMIDDRIAGVTQAQSVIARTSRARADADMA